MKNSSYFPKGNIPWNKGLTKDDPRVANYGRKGSKTKLKMSQEGKLPISWNKGLTKEIDSRLAHLSELTSKRRKGTKLSKKWTESMSKSYRKQYANGERKWWGLNPKNKEIWERVRKKFGSEEAQLKAFQANGKHQENKLETYFQTILDSNFPGKWRFVGGGTFRIGRKFPDFVHITDKKVILVNGVFWHTKFKHQENLSRAEIEFLESIPYSEHGYRVLHFWEDELISRTKGGLPIYDKDVKLILDKIVSFDV